MVPVLHRTPEQLRKVRKTFQKSLQGVVLGRHSPAPKQSLGTIQSPLLATVWVKFSRGTHTSTHTPERSDTDTTEGAGEAHTPNCRTVFRNTVSGERDHNSLYSLFKQCTLTHVSDLLTELIMAASLKLVTLFFVEIVTTTNLGSPPIPQDDNQMLFIFTENPSHFACLSCSKCVSKTAHC